MVPAGSELVPSSRPVEGRKRMVSSGSARAGKWRGGIIEASLKELLSDEAARALMQADRVTIDDVWTAISHAVRRVETKRINSRQ
jgi:hypothetical protein